MRGWLEMAEQREYDVVDGPRHYRWLNGLEVIDITEQLNFNLGNVIKYTLRSAYKGKQLEDLDKAIWYLQREKQRIVASIPEAEIKEAVDTPKELPLTDVKIGKSGPDSKVYVTGYISAPEGQEWIMTNTAGLDIADRYPNYRNFDNHRRNHGIDDSYRKDCSYCNKDKDK